MVYLETWDEFAEKAEHLFRSEPLRVGSCTLHLFLIRTCGKRFSRKYFIIGPTMEWKLDLVPGLLDCVLPGIFQEPSMRSSNFSPSQYTRKSATVAFEGGLVTEHNEDRNRYRNRDKECSRNAQP